MNNKKQKFFINNFINTKKNEQIIEYIKNYKYDSFKNISLYEYIKSYISNYSN